MNSPIQIVTLSDEEDGSRLLFNQKAFQQCLEGLEPESKVVVVTINGALRTGKSFLMNALVHYLQNGPFTESTHLSHNFHWRHGVEADTMGMWLWGRPIPIKLKDGQPAYLLLIDTQGIFDANLNPKLTTCLFGLSTLISSVQIYNLERRIQEDHLQHLELFTEYAKVISENLETSEIKPFQQLHFLVRDWTNFQSSQDPVQCQRESDQYLKSILEGEKNPHATRTRHNIQRCYQRLNCSCLPHPGLELAEGRFHQNFSVLTPGFIANLNFFLEQLTTQWEAKQIFGETVQLQQVGEYLNRYLEMLYTHPNLPEPDTILNTTVEVLEIGIRHQALREYRDLMQQRLDQERGLGQSQLRQIHQRQVTRVIQTVRPKLVMGETSRHEQFLQHLGMELEREYQHFVQLNRQKLQSLTYWYVALIALTSWLVSYLTPWICTADICYQVSHLSYGLFLLLVLTVVARFMYLMGAYDYLLSWVMKQTLTLPVFQTPHPKQE